MVCGEDGGRRKLGSMSWHSPPVDTAKKHKTMPNTWFKLYLVCWIGRCGYCFAQKYFLLKIGAIKTEQSHFVIQTRNIFNLGCCILVLVCVFSALEISIASGTMAASSDRPIFPVSTINPQTRDWTALVQVVERHREQVGSPKNGKEGKHYRRYVLVDEHGTKVSAIVFEPNIHFFDTKLLPFKRYKISNADLIPAVSFFKVGEYLFTWVLDYKKLVEPIQEEVCPCLPFTTTVCAFTDFSRHADAESYFDVKAIVIHAFPQKQVKPKSYQRDLVVIDESKIPIILTLWDDFAKEEGLLISSLFPATTIIIAHNVKATTFHGLSLSTRKYSYLMINPPLPDSLSLRGWREDNKDEIAAMLENKAYINPSYFFPPPAASDVITVTEAISLLPVRKTAWVIGKPNFKFTKYKLWSALCLNCNARLDIPIEWVFDCSTCGSPLGFELRSSVPFQLTDDANMLSVTIKTPDVQLLTKITPQQLRDSHEFGLGVQGDLKIALEKLTLVCFLRSKKKKKDDPQPTDIVRYTAIKAYDATAIGIAAAFTSPTTKPAIEDDASGAKQLFSPERSASSKRNIADVSESSMLANTGKGLNQESATSSLVMESATATTDPQSPSKKTKDKVKLN